MTKRPRKIMLKYKKKSNKNKRINNLRYAWRKIAAIASDFDGGEFAYLY